jgi:beta-1,2-mannobiose phosphorylase / 1,2-beta-oligomannan phosphorylase
MPGFQMRRLGVVMRPEPGNALEVEGVLNPAATRGPDGQLYLFPRLVARGNYSRIGIARVIFNAGGDPVDVERLGIALEPQADYELRADGGGCEDPRISYVKPIDRFIMTYTALSTRGPRIAMAQSQDLIHWERLGLVTFEPYEGIEFNGIDNKDASVFPVPVPNPFGQPAMAILHRPLFPGTRPEETVSAEPIRTLDLHRESIWISYCAMSNDAARPNHLSHFTSHNRLASPVSAWERLKIGGGTPPVLTRHGWMVIYHGVQESKRSNLEGCKYCYSAGVLVLDEKHPRHIRYRSPTPVLRPETPEELTGTIGNVVFPTGIDRREDLGLPHRLDVYYGMADDRIGVARLDVPDHLPPGSSVDPPDSRV